MYIQVKPGHETSGNVKRLRNDQCTKQIVKARKEFRLESINTNQVATINKATICHELPFMRWYMEMPSWMEAKRARGRGGPTTLRGPWGWTQSYEGDRRQTKRLVQDEATMNTLKKAWIEGMQAENYPANGVAAFLPRI